jgi:hypothetical protein
MKGIQGLVIAIVLGIVGAAFNWVYLNNKSKEFEIESFIGVKKGQTIALGAPIKKAYLEKIDIPKSNARNLKVYAYPHENLDSLIGQKSIRKYEGGELLLRQDFQTHPNRLNLENKQQAFWVPIDTRTTITSHITPGITQVYFFVPGANNQKHASPSSEDRDWLGPFEVLSVGNRFGSVDTMKASKTAPKNEHMLTLRATDKNGKPNNKASRLVKHLTNTDYQPLRLKVLKTTKDSP